MLAISISVTALLARRSKDGLMLADLTNAMRQPDWLRQLLQWGA